MYSPSLLLGSSFLPRCTNINSFVTGAATAIRANPEIAAEITLAATNRILELQRSERQTDPLDLQIVLSKLVSESCKARDESTHA